MIRTAPAPLRPRGPAARHTDHPHAPFAPLPFAPEAGPHLAGRGHLDAAQSAWQAHVDAGRIGVPAPPPPGGEHGLAALAGILGAGRRGNVW